MKSNRGQNVRFVVSSLLFVTSLLRPIVPSLRCRRFLVSICHSSHRFVSSMFFSLFCFAYLTAPEPVAKILRHSEEKRPFLPQIAASHRSVRHNTDLPPPFHSKMFLQVLSIQSSIAFSFDKGWRGITSTRSWTDHLSQNTAQGLKIFCNWL